MAKGSIPSKGLIQIDAHIEEWREARPDIKPFETEALIPITEGMKAKVQIVIQFAYPPELMQKFSTKGTIKTGFASQRQANGLERSIEAFMNSMFQKCWALYGYIPGDKMTPICIMTVPELNFSSYSLKGDTETDQEFNPSMN